MNETWLNLTAQQLRKAAELQEKIEFLKDQLSSELGATGSAPERTLLDPKRRFSAATIAKMRASQRARWAALRDPDSSKSNLSRGRRKMSAAARARLSQVAKARWKRAYAAGKSRL